MAVVLLFMAGGVLGQDPQPEPEELTIAKLQERKEALSTNESLTEEVREDASAILDAAIASLTTRNSWRQKKRQFESATAAAPENLRLVQEETSTLPSQYALGVSNTADLPDAQAALETAQADAKAANELVESLKADGANRDTARKELPERAASVRLKLASPIEDESLLPVEGDPPVIADAKNTGIEALRAAQKAEAEAVEAELDSYIKREQLLAARIELAEKRKLLADDLVTRLQDVVAGAREREAEKEAEEASRARREAADSHPAIRKVAEENEELAKRRTGNDGLPARISAATDELNETKATLEETSEDFDRMRQRVERVGMTDAVGLMLRRRRDGLPSTTLLEDNIESREEELAAVQLQLLDVEDRIASLRDVDDAVTERLKDTGLSGSDRTEVENSLRRQLTAQSGYLQSLRDDYERLLSLLLELDIAERELVAELEGYRDYVDERVLWIRSAEIVGPRHFTNAGSAIGWLFDTDNMKSVAQAIADDARRHPFEFLFTGVIWLAVLGVQFVARSRVKKSAEVVAKNKAAPFWFTLQAFIGTAVISLPVSLAMWLIAWRLKGAPGTGEYGRAIAAGLEDTALLFLALSFLRHTLHPQGLGPVQFRWSEKVCKSLRKQLNWLLPLTAVLAFVIMTMNSQSSEVYVNSLGRFAMLIQLGASLVFMHILLRPKGPLANEFKLKRNNKLASKGSTVIWVVALLIPLVIAALALIGFNYTAAQLLARYVMTLLIGLGVVMLNGMLSRWFELSETRIAIRIRKRKQKRKSLSAEEQKLEAEKDSVEEVDLVEVRKQTTSLRRSLVVTATLFGILLVWYDVLPALGFLDQIELWKHTGTITGEDGAAVETQVPVTLGNLLLGILFVVLTIVGARTVPGFLETTILQRLKLSSGIRYAFKSISRYVIAAAGAVISFRAIGIGWQDVQWLVAGFSVGLGFGLQEIFANFVSGLILLIERPVRVGDTVTVNNITGRVTRINMRATTIEDWDMKELIVPNKAFITTEIINWSLSSDVLRLVVKVGVAYGSDLKAVEENLLRVADEAEEVLRTPPPHTMFSGFGDSTLDFELRCFVSGIQDFRFVRDDLNKAIDTAFKEAGIEIAFPQRTLWVRDFEAPLKVIQDLDKQPPTAPEKAADDS